MRRAEAWAKWRAMTCSSKGIAPNPPAIELPVRRRGSTGPMSQSLTVVLTAAIACRRSSGASANSRWYVIWLTPYAAVVWWCVLQLCRAPRGRIQPLSQMGQDLQAHDRKWLEGLPRKQGTRSLETITETNSGVCVGNGCGGKGCGGKRCEGEACELKARHEAPDKHTLPCPCPVDCDG